MDRKSYIFSWWWLGALTGLGGGRDECGRAIWQALASSWGRYGPPFRQPEQPRGRLVCFSVISVNQMGALGTFAFGPCGNQN